MMLIGSHRFLSPQVPALQRRALSELLQPVIARLLDKLRAAPSYILVTSCYIVRHWNMYFALLLLKFAARLTRSALHEQ